MKTQIIEKDGKPEYAILPYDEYEALIEALEDAADTNAVFDETDLVPIELVDRLIAGESPIKVWREHRGLNQTKLAEAVGVSAGYLSQIENSAREGTIELFRKIAAVLQVSIDDLVKSQDQ